MLREMGIGIIWEAGMMAAMAAVCGLYRSSFSRRRLFLFYGVACAGGIALRLLWQALAFPIGLYNSAFICFLAWGTWKITGERAGRVITVFCLLFTGAAFCEISAGIIFFHGPAQISQEVWESKEMVQAALLGNFLWPVYLWAAAALWRQMEKRCSQADSRQLSFLIVAETACLALLMIFIFCGGLKWEKAVGIGIFLQVGGTLGFARLQLKHEEIKAMEQQVKQLEMRSEEEYARYVELERKYRTLHQIRHDFHNQLATAYYLMQAGEEGQALELLNELDVMLEVKEQDEEMPQKSGKFRKQGRKGGKKG